MLLVDIGNTRIKAGVLTARGIESLPALDRHAEQPFAAWTNAGQDPARVVVSNVAGTGIAGTLAQYVYERWHLEAEFVSPVRSRCGMTTRYSEPERLGVDRWLAALAAWHDAGNTVCVLDMGTALTVDVVTADGEHLGGLIAPGVDLMRQSLTRGTAQLSSNHADDVSGFAINTNDAIALGCRAALRGLVEQVRLRIEATAETRGACWYLTGGGAPLLAECIGWPAETVPDLVLRGLALIAEDDI